MACPRARIPGLDGIKLDGRWQVKTPASTVELGKLLRAVRIAADWDRTSNDGLALIDDDALARAGEALRAFADLNPSHSGAAAARSLADLVKATADLKPWNASHDINEMVRASARIVALAGEVPATNDTPRAVLATINRTSPAAKSPRR